MAGQSPWPGTYRAAISLTFDDGLPSHLNLAVPMLEEHNLRGTFYVNPRDGYQEKLAPWRQVVLNGHELGNHTINHPCAYNNAAVTSSGRRGLEDMNLDEMEWEIVETKKRFHDLVPEQVDTSFAYPCYQSFVGRGVQRQSYVPLVARHCVAGRGLGGGSLGVNDPLRCDLAYLWSHKCERMTAAQLIGLAEQAAEMGRWAIMTFHGVHEGHLPVGERDLAEFCAYLARQSDHLWSAPVATIARHLADWRAVHLQSSPAA